jgi:hypothetical protein
MIVFQIGEPGWDRTSDLLIKRHGKNTGYQAVRQRAHRKRTHAFPRLPEGTAKL